MTDPTQSGCTCPPMVDVFRGRVVGTREPCPIHPEPDLSKIDLRPAMDLTNINLKPLR